MLSPLPRRWQSNPSSLRSEVTRTSYYPIGQVKAQWGDQTNAVFHVYDAQGRQIELRTYQSLAHGTEPTAATTGAATTTWTYSPTRGFLTRKEYADGKGTDYTYAASGRLATRTWARGVVTAYTYEAGQLVHTNYSDTTPDVTVAYDSFGRQTSVTNGVATTTYAYDATTLALDTETISYDLNADSTPDFTRVLNRSQDDLKRDNGWRLKDGTTIENEVAYAFDISGRLGGVTSPAGAFTYTFEANSTGLLHIVTGPAHTVTNSWDATRDVLTLKGNKVGATTISSYGYGVNEIGQRTDVANVATTGSAFASTRSIAWGYDALGQVTKADSTITGFDRAYEYDGIGNRKEAADSLTLTGTPNYGANALNQYTAVGSLVPVYDLDGNAEAYPVPAHLSANSVLGWDAENRLKSATVNSVTTTYLYDAGSRRIAQTTGSATTVYVYDGWNPVAEYTGTNLAKTYTWGLDLSGSLQGAGGVGGLLAVTDQAASGTPSFFPTFDGNGNVSEYLDGIGTVEAHYEYDPFGRTTVASEAKAADFAHRYSTKPIDSATGLFYYGYRWFDPVAGRWPSRDPIAERGGVNLYGFVGNATTYSIDILGLQLSFFGPEILLSPQEMLVPKEVVTPRFVPKFVPPDNIIPFPSPTPTPTPTPIPTPYPTPYPPYVGPPTPSPTPSPGPSHSPNPIPTPWNNPRHDDRRDVGEVFYRSMMGTLMPTPGDTARHLGVRPNVDVDIQDGLVNTYAEDGSPQGMSVANMPENLPGHRRPPLLGGTGKDPVWQYSVNRLPATLIYIRGFGGHGFVAPAGCMKFEDYQAALRSTALFWSKLVPGSDIKGNHPYSVEPWYNNWE